jgi:hypothetical protein
MLIARLRPLCGVPAPTKGTLRDGCSSIVLMLDKWIPATAMGAALKPWCASPSGA